MADIDYLNELICQVIICQNQSIKASHFSLISPEAFDCLLKQSLCALQKDPAFLMLRGPIIVVGDLHGNLDDLLRIFQRNRYPPSTTYLFLGDYIDRGKYSVEIIVLLLALKVKFPNNIYMLMGNHESKRMICKNQIFKEECEKKISCDAFEGIKRSFSLLPKAAIINNEIFCVHGGISKNLMDIDKMKKYLNEKTEKKYVQDLLWNDPDEKTLEFAPNDRNVGEIFGKKPLERFLKNNNLKCLIRAHEFVPKGFCWNFGDLCLTVFSSSNYQKMNNLASIALINENSEISLQLIAPLTEECIYKRRRTFPYWLLESQSVKKSFVKPVFNKIFI